MADKTKIWGASPWWIFSWGGRAGASPHLYSQILTPPRLTRNLLLILITPREWIGRNIRQIDLSYIFYLHIPVTEAQAHFLCLYFFICFRGSLGCNAPLGPHSRLRAWVLPSELKKAFQEGRGEVCRRVGGLCFSWFRVKRDFFPSFPSLLPATYLILSAGAWPCAWSCGDENTIWPSLQVYYGPDSTLCFMGTGFCFVLSLFLTS